MNPYYSCFLIQAFSNNKGFISPRLCQDTLLYIIYNNIKLNFHVKKDC